MGYETILVEDRGHWTCLKLNRPQALNAITPQMLEELDQALGAALADPKIGVIVLTGEGRAFSAGVDLKALNELKLFNGKVGDILDVPARRLIRRMTESSKCIIAAVNGACFTGALELALACDLVYVAEEAKLGDTHAKWGLRPTWGMSQRLPAAVGLRNAKELSYTARTFSGVEAAALGVANAAFPREELMERVGYVVDQICANSAASIAAYKDLYRVAAARGLEAGLQEEEARDYPIGDSMTRLAEFLK
ncbi:MAG: enoyl-CoA hydratase/isomerase family protein [Candidatus Hydrogenedentes bacterium]|nr:enoyl-CoA hydratase/isomerase family protein [Candidatus Hydrogenedentota bacterium]